MASEAPDDDAGDAREEHDDVDDDEEEEGLVPLGDVLVSLDAHRRAAADETAKDLLTRQGKTLPHAMDAERATLGACILGSTEVAVAVRDTGLRAEHFYRPQHGTIWRAILKLIDEQEPVDALTVVDVLMTDGDLDRVGGAAAISQLEALLPTVAHATAYATIVVGKAQLRAVINTSIEMAADAYAQAATAEEIVEGARVRLAKLVGVGSSAVRPMGVIVAEVAQSIPMLGGTLIKHPTGFKDLDAILGGGFNPGDLVICAGRPSMGKTEFALNVTAWTALEQRQRVYFSSLEMKDGDLTRRMVYSRAQVDGNRPPAKAKQGEINRLKKSLSDLSSAPIDIFQKPAQTLVEVQTEARRSAAKGNLGFVFVDYLTLMRTEKELKGGELDAGAVAQLTKGLKGLARELDVPVVALAQLNRGVEQRQNKRPMMSDLRESGAIEQDADAILLFYREEYYSKAATPADKVGEAEVEVAKQRNGPAGVTIFCRFEGTPPRFANKT